MMSQQLDREKLEKLLQAENIKKLSFPDLVELVQGEITGFLPDGVYQIDPRNGDLILYHSSRARRPHDNQLPPPEIVERACAICQGKTTSVVDVAELSEGFTFINLNLFPVVYPLDGVDQTYGLHLLQWTSSQHDKDWHNMPLADCVVVMERLAALEKKLLTGSRELTLDRRGCVVIIKNYGRLVGGSLAHGHQQIAFGNVIPRRFRDNRRFEQERRETFSAYLLRENPPELLVRDYGPVLLFGRVIFPELVKGSVTYSNQFGYMALGLVLNLAIGIGCCLLARKMLLWTETENAS
jgi:hypothetical protein